MWPEVEISKHYLPSFAFFVLGQLVWQKMVLVVYGSKMVLVVYVSKNRTSNSYSNIYTGLGLT